MILELVEDEDKPGEKGRHVDEGEELAKDEVEAEEIEEIKMKLERGRHLDVPVDIAREKDEDGETGRI